MQVWPAGSPSLYTPHPFSNYLLGMLQCCNANTEQWYILHLLAWPHWSNLALPDHTIYVYFIEWGISAQTCDRTWLTWGTEWAGSFNKIQTAIFTNTLRYVCVSENTCCVCILLFFLLTSPEEIIMRQNETEIKTFHEMVTFQCFSKHFEDAF